jgi:hypothetical protein
LQGCFDSFEVCFNIISFFLRLAVDLADKNLQMSTNPNSWQYGSQSFDDLIGLIDKFKILFDGYRKMFDQSFSKSKELGDLLRFLPGVVVQKHMNMQEMGDLYRIKPDLLERLINSSIEPLKASPSSRYILDDYLSCFLQDGDRSQHYYCDPMLQHISICCYFLSLLDASGSNAFDLHS